MLQKVFLKNSFYHYVETRCGLFHHTLTDHHFNLSSPSNQLGRNLIVDSCLRISVCFLQDLSFFSSNFKINYNDLRCPY